MAIVYLSIGSNIDREKNIKSCLNALTEHFGEMVVSSFYESEAVGFEGDNFINLVTRIETGLSVGDLLERLRNIEDDNGRVRGGERFSARTLDIDILTYDDLVGTFDGVDLPRDEILKNAFVLWPMAEIAPEAIHPQNGQSYAQLWDTFEQASQKLWIVEL